MPNVASHEHLDLPNVASHEHLDLPRTSNNNTDLATQNIANTKSSFSPAAHRGSAAVAIARLTIFASEEIDCLHDSDADPDYIISDSEKMTNTEAYLSDASNITNSPMSSSVSHISETTVEEIAPPKLKRKKRTVSRKQDSKTRKQELHIISETCKPNCPRKCRDKIPENLRKEINAKYWEMNWKDQREFCKQNAVKIHIARRKVKGQITRKQNTIRYTLKDSNGMTTQVCKVFMLTTLGFKKNSDSVIMNCLNEFKDNVPIESEDKRGKHAPKHKMDHEIIKAHVELYHPEQPHYRREHAPQRRYLSSDVTIQKMHADFLTRFTERPVSYDLYRKVLSKEMNISFSKLGHEECERCEIYVQHKVSCETEICDQCDAYFLHIGKATIARKQYQQDASKESVEREMIVSVDMEKIIMIPRMEQHKTCLFTRRITVMHETFASVGLKKTNKNVAIIWHEGIAGRNDEDVASAFWKFFKEVRDAKCITIWVDNCSAQNKNWTLFTMICTAGNHEDISADTITLKFFEAGHTYMSADPVHAAVERQIKQSPKLYDFADFANCEKKQNVTPLKCRHLTLENGEVAHPNTNYVSLLIVLICQK